MAKPRRLFALRRRPQAGDDGQRSQPPESEQRAATLGTPPARDFGSADRHSADAFRGQSEEFDATGNQAAAEDAAALAHQYEMDAARQRAEDQRDQHRLQAGRGGERSPVTRRVPPRSRGRRR